MSSNASDLPVCPLPHPHGAVYRMQHLIESEPEYARPRPLLCPWCDWERLRACTARPTGKSASATAQDAGIDVDEV